jgi:hypothetical protein
MVNFAIVPIENEDPEPDSDLRSCQPNTWCCSHGFVHIGN